MSTAREAIRMRVARDLPDVASCVTGWRRTRLRDGTRSMTAQVNRLAWPAGPREIEFYVAQDGTLCCASKQGGRVKYIAATEDAFFVSGLYPLGRPEMN